MLEKEKPRLRPKSQSIGFRSVHAHDSLTKKTGGRQLVCNVPNEANMNAEIAVRGTAVQTDENSISGGCPRRLRGTAVEAGLDAKKAISRAVSYHSSPSIEGMARIQGQSSHFSNSGKDTYLILLLGSKLAQQSLTLLLGQGCHLQKTAASV